MDNRVYAAFALHLKPVTTGKEIQAPLSAPEVPAFQKSEYHQPKKEAAPHLSVVGAPPPLANEAASLPSVSNQFVKLFTLLKKEQDPYRKSIGKRTYRLVQMTLRKTTKLKKGSMLDERAE